MKKLLALVLVLGLAQFVSAAALSYNVAEVEGNVLDFNKTYTLELVLTADAGENVSSFNTALKAGGASLGDIALGGVNEKFQNGLWTAGSSMDNGGVKVWDTKGSTILTGPYGEDGDVLATWTFTTNDVAGEITFDDYAGPGLAGPPIPYSTKVSAVATDIEAATYVVPEPMTMSLLGLGGLALIRRRRNA